MPKREFNSITQFTDVTVPEVRAPRDPSMGETFGAAFRMENDVMAVIDIMTRPVYEEEEGWRTKSAEWLKTKDLWDYRDNFLGAKSEAEALSIADRIRQEEQDRSVLNDAGWAGISAQIIAGSLSPTMFIPLAAGGRGAVAFGRAALLGLGAGALQEIPIQLAQETRTAGETTASLAASTILGGLLGGAAQVITREGFDDLANALSRDMATSTTELAIPRAVGASEARAADAGRFADAGGAVTAFKKMSPVMRVVEQTTSPVARWMMTQLADAGLRFERNVKNVPTTPGGTAENLIKVWYGGYAKGVKAIDDNYAAFVYDGNVPAFAPNVRALAAGQSRGGAFTKKAFREEIARAMRNGDESANPYVASAAKALRKEIYEPMLKAAQDAGVIKKELDGIKGDVSYLFRDYSRRAIEANYGEFIDVLSGHYEKKLLEGFSSKVENFKKAKERDEELIEDLKVTDVEKQKDIYGDQLKAVESEGNATHFIALEETVANLRAMARELTDAKDSVMRRQMMADAKEMETSAEGFKEFKADRAKVKRRLSNLNKSQVVLEARVAKKLEKIDRAEELSLGTLRRIVGSAQKLIDKLDTLSDEAFEKGANEFRAMFERVARQYDKGEERIVQAVKNEADPETGRILGIEALQQQRADKMSDIAERLETLENVDRAGARELLEDALQETLQRANDIVGRRAVRTERLRAAVTNMAPEELTKRIEKIKAGQAAKQAAQEERVLRMGADDVDLTNGTANFARVAKEAAESVGNKIRGVHLRLPAFEIMQGERGAELSRVLDIPSADIEKFLENDVETLTRRYLRTLAPDIEISKKFGDVNGEELFRQLVEEESAALQKVRETALQKKKDAFAKGKKNVDQKKLDAITMTEEELQLASVKVADEYRAMRRDLTAVIGRLRHTWGLPDDPDGMAFRMGRLALNLNVLRLMGGVVISSIPDIARPMMKYGVTRTFRDGFLPLITSLKEMKMSMKEVQYAGGALDVLIHSRSQALFDTIDDLGRGSKFEKGVEFATNKIGIIAGFDYWTSALKQLSGAVTNAKLMDNIREAAEGKISAKDLGFLNSNGIDLERARSIWQDVIENGGGDKVNGVWLPNTESWKNAENVSAYRAALVREVDSTIITPGVDKALWTDKTMLGRLLGQFKGFTMASTSRTLVAGLQERDAAFVSGTVWSLALGALSYYTWAKLAGGDAETEMMNADAGKWADEMIDRSGLLGVLSEGQNLLQKIPATQPYVSFGGGRPTRRGGGSMMEALGGPSYDLADKTFSLINDLDDPTQQTLHTLRTMAPLQNVFYLRQIFDKLEAAAGDNLNLPENRR